jgi:C_GCAxxG_C_C family probable redox protein
MDESTKQKIIVRAGEFMDQGYHCSEAILLAVGGHYLGDEKVRQALPFSSSFAGGVGGSRAELCGALTGGLMVIGGLYGRVVGPIPDQQCQDLAAQFRADFLQEFGWLKCGELKEHWIGNAGQESCKLLVERAAGVLVNNLNGVIK